MSRISIIFHLLVFVSIGLLQNVRADDPQDLVKARKSYREKMERATKPIMQGYVKYLESIKRKLGGRGKAEDALAVQKEIDAISGQLLAMSEAGAIIGSWQSTAPHYRNIYTLHPDGRMTSSKRDSAVSKWQHAGGRKFALKYKDGRTSVAILSADGTRWQWGEAKDGEPLIMNRIGPAK